MRTSLSSLFLGHSSVIEGLKGGRGRGEEDGSQILVCFVIHHYQAVPKKAFVNIIGYLFFHAPYF